VAKERSFSGDEARLLLRRARTGTLASLNREDGIPYASLVNVATDVEGRPLILVSTLAWHTRNLSAEPRASVMVAEPPAEGDALTGARVTVMGRFEKTGDPALRRRYLARHPEAAAYASFGDFAVWRLAPERVHAVAGFGRIETLDADEVFPSSPEMLAIEESAILHMNEDHAEAVEAYAVRLLGAAPGPWKVVSIDPDGADLQCDQRIVRLPFGQPANSAAALRQTFAAISRRLPTDV